MIAADTSALVAIVLGEPDAELCLAQLRHHPCLLAAVSLTEAAIVVEARQGPDATRDLQLLVEATVDEVVAVDADQAWSAVAAWRRFGKSRHPAGLNLGDCFAYALAHDRGVPLLFKGQDFVQTDIGAVL